MRKSVLERKLEAFSLAELLLGMALFALLITTVATFSIDALRATQNSRVRVEVTQKSQGQKKALLLHKDTIWKDIIDMTDNGEFHLEYTNNTYEIVVGSQNDSESNLYINIYPAYRDNEGNLSTIPGTEDIHSKNVVITAEWLDFLGVTNSLQTNFFLTDWSTLKYEETLETDFDNGSFDMTRVTNTNGGEIKMQTVVYADWCNPSITSTTYDLPGSGAAKTIIAEQGHAYIGTGDNASGISIANVIINPADPPTVNVSGTFDGYKTNAIYGKGDYAYLATDTNSEEMLIVDVSNTPYTKVGYLDAPRNKDADAIVVSGDYAYLSVGDSLYSINIATKSGAHSVLNSATLSGTASKLFIRGNYIYATILGNSSVELEIIDISTPSSMSIVGNANVFADNGVSVYVNEANTRAYLATEESSSYPEAYIIDITTKTGSRSIVGSYDTNGMSPTDITAPEGFPRMIVAGSGGIEQYQVATTVTESNPQYCGGQAVASGIKGMVSLTESNGDSYTYFTTGDSSNELQIIRGGPGGGGADGIGYPDSATYTSSIFDTNSTDAQFYYLEWGKNTPANTTLKFRIRTDNTTDFTGIEFVGPDGTNSTYFTNNSGQEIPLELSGKQFFQYKAYFTTTDTEETAILNNVILTYQK